MPNPRMRTDPSDAKLLISEASPVVRNLAFAVYMPDFSGPVLGTFGSKDDAIAFCARVNDVVREFGGEPMPVQYE
jgi:hypothetical protein